MLLRDEEELEDRSYLTNQYYGAVGGEDRIKSFIRIFHLILTMTDEINFPYPFID